MILEGLFGGLLGALTRLAPEILNFFDKKNERKHELAMFTLQTDLEKVRGNFKIEESYIDYSKEQLTALGEAYKQQAVAESKASQWVASASAFVRPGITYVIFALYVLFKITMIVSGLLTGQGWLLVFGTWTEADMAMLNMVISFWFVNRSIEKYRQ